MGLITDAADSIMDSLKEGLAGAVSNALSTCVDLLTMGLNPASGKGSGEVTGLMGQFLFTHPANFTGTSGGSKIWDTIQTISDNAVVPIAGGIFAILVTYDLIYMVMSGNNFNEYDGSVVLKWILKVVAGCILISNITDITAGLLSFGNSVAVTANNTLFGSGGFATSITSPDSQKFIDGLSNQSFGYILVCLIASGFLLLVVMATLALIIVTMASRMIEIFMYVGISPIPIVTFMNTDSKPTGQNWLRNILALGFQGLFIALAIGIFLVLFNNACKEISKFISLVILIGYALALMFTVLRSGQISKSVFGAH